MPEDCALSPAVEKLAEQRRSAVGVAWGDWDLCRRVGLAVYVKAFDTIFLLQRRPTVGG